MKTIKIKRFSQATSLNFFPPFLEAQYKSWEDFWSHKLPRLFSEIFPVLDHTENHWKLEFSDCYLAKPNYANFSEAVTKGESYTAPLRAKFKLTNLKTKKATKEEFFLFDCPMITSGGTFIINGVERVIVPQLVRSPGIFFDSQEGEKYYFGAAIIPERGAWLNFKMTKTGLLQARINRRKNVLATTFLRAIGYSSDEDIKNAFKGLDKESEKLLSKTLEKDLTHNQEEAMAKIYQLLRPGGVVTGEMVRDFVQGMFFDITHYDLAEVGRWKINQRLYSSLRQSAVPKERTLRKEDIILTIKEIFRLNQDPQAQPDIIDHLANRRVRDLGELLQSSLRPAFLRIRRSIQDKMSTAGGEGILTPSGLVDSRPLAVGVRRFFATSAFSQFLDSDNPLAALEHKRRLSSTGPGGLIKRRAGFEARDVRPSHYGRICPIETPEGQNVGLVTHLAIGARINDYGFIETPYFKVRQGKVTSEVIYFNAQEEEKFRITHSGIPLSPEGKILEKEIEGRYQGHPVRMLREEAEFIDISPNQVISVAASLIPFLRNDDANRAMMGCNMQRQAVPLIQPEAPFIGTGTEVRTARESGQVILAEEGGKVTEVDSQQIKVGRHLYPLSNFRQTNQYTCFHQHPVVEKGQTVKKGDILAEGASIDQGRLALGKNILVAFMSFRGMNYEDAIVISERLVKKDAFTSIRIKDFICDVRNTEIGPEVTTPDIPNVGGEKLKDLDEEGIIRIGAEVKPGDILVGKISPKGQIELSPEERLVKAIFGEKAKEVKDTSLVVPHGQEGRVINIQIFSRDEGAQLEAGVLRRIKVQLAQFRKIEAGDKLSGRHGNKGVISFILPEEEMPFLDDGTPIDVILNPMGVISRMNIGQILETHLGWAASRLGYLAEAPGLLGVSKEKIKEELKAAGLPESGQVWLYDGRTGEKFPRPITVGIMYMLKLHHMVQDKIHMRSIGPYSLITQQPLGGKAHFGGQRFGEMEVWALEGYGAADTLQEMMTIKSDDVRGRSEAYEDILQGRPIVHWYRPASVDLLINELKALALNIKLEIKD
jgi:DNA-directed RNA polymerase subunit beta